MRTVFWSFLVLPVLALPAQEQAPRPYPPDPPMPAYALPDLLAGAQTPQDWARRRQEILELFRRHVYGRVPATSFTAAHEVVENNPAALDGAAKLKRVNIVLKRGEESLTIRLALFTPNRTPAAAAPTFLLICNRPPTNIDPTRAVRSAMWPVEEAIARGYGMAAFHVSDVDPDKHDHFQEGAHRLLDVEPRGPDAWGTIAAWAWGMSRAMDYLVTDPDVDAARVAVIGQSRGGKTALWAGAQDERFALTISNDSGNTGASISRRRFPGKELIARINTAFPHWFCEAYKAYGGREDDLPVDQHMLLALIAPRALAVGSASEDLWADPRGEFLSAVHASPAWRLLGKTGLGTETMPPIDGVARGPDIQYHLRPGKHDITLYDWERYMDFADSLWPRTR